MNYLIRAWFVLIFACASFMFGAHTTHAATLYLSPASGSYAVGKTFTVNVMVGTPDQAANAYSGTITYPTDKLEMTAIGKGGSVVSLWVQEPSFSAGRANFEGVTFNPGYKGGAGRIVSLTFRAKAVGTAAVRFSAGSVLANDGQGTSILKGMGGATFTITGAAPTPPAPPKPPAPPAPPKPPAAVEIPASPVISSVSHPDPAQWYAINQATFSWGLQPDVNAVSHSIDQNPVSDPGTVSAGLFSSAVYENVQDGIWYFHLRARNKGGWSVTSHFKIQVDTTKPDSFTILEALTDSPNRMTKAFTFGAIDSGSGIDHYEVQLDDGVPSTWVDDGTHLFQAPALSAGAHALRAKAVDKAGNFLETLVNFTIVGLPIPQIIEYPASPKTGDELVLKGNAVPNSRVTIWIQKAQELPYSRQIISDMQGRFAFIAEETLEQTTYQVWATVSDAFGNISLPSEKITLVVQAPPFDFWAWIGDFLLKNRCILTISLLLLILIILLTKYLLLRKKLGHNVQEAQEALQLAFGLLKDDIQIQIKMLEQAKTERELTMEENRILEKLNKDLVTAENYIRQRIEAIGKQ